MMLILCNTAENDTALILVTSWATSCTFLPYDKCSSASRDQRLMQT